MTGVLVSEEAAAMAASQGAVSGETRPGNDEEILKNLKFLLLASVVGSQRNQGNRVSVKASGM